MKCKRCDYEWEAILEKPKQCPACKSYRWDTDKKEVRDDNDHRNS